jgi:hypothetical protein
MDRFSLSSHGGLGNLDSPSIGSSGRRSRRSSSPNALAASIGGAGATMPWNSYQQYFCYEL